MLDSLSPGILGGRERVKPAGDSAPGKWLGITLRRPTAREFRELRCQRNAGPVITR